MENDLELIKQLEEKLGKNLKEIPHARIGTSLDNSYAVDDNGNVTGLNLLGTETMELSSIAIEKFNHLTHLSLDSNKLSNISFLEKITQLKRLDLENNQISDISPIVNLTNLTTLTLYNNKISDISALKKLTQLTKLKLYDNQITDISALETLTQLKRLDLENNQITDISVLKGLKNLKKLTLTKNKITRLPIEVAQLGMDIKWEYWGEDGIFLEGNPLESPPVEVVKRGTAAVLNYFQELQKAQVQLMECKVLIVGNGEVGKTSLMKKLTDPDYQLEEGKEPTTLGIRINPWSIDCHFPDINEPESVKVHFWDFGGQAIYHATHQFFLTKRSLYLFIWDSRKEEETLTFDYWLNIIKLLGKDSPVLVVMNKSDVRIKHLDEALFKKNFKNIVTFLKVSCKTGEGIPQLAETIQNTLTGMPHLRDSLPKSWQDIRRRLETVGAGRNYISIDDYYEICREYGLDEEGADFLADYLHDLGIILRFQDDKLLKRTVILNPEWATEAVYSLIDTHEILLDKGRFRYDDLKRHWDLKKYPRGKHLELIQLMEKFELCFNITGTDRYIIPELLLPKQPESTGNFAPGAAVLRFEFSYRFMPSGIISRFISRCYYMVMDERFWKNGVELRFEQTAALVTRDPLARKTSIVVSGPEGFELITLIRGEMDHIHRSLNMKKDLHYKELIPCNCEMCSNSVEPNFYEYAVLMRFIEKDRSSTICNNSAESVAIQPLLKGYESPNIPKPERYLQHILSAARHFLDIAKSLKTDENSRNTFITKLMSVKGIIVKDQSLSGRSATGKSIGSPDFKFTDINGDVIAFMEAFILKSCDKTSISLHLKKLFNYDAVGISRNFILVYAENHNFVSLWKKYIAYIPEIDFGNYRIHSLEEVDSQSSSSEIKVACARHRRNDCNTEVYHIFVNVGR
jgi:internalin A